MEKLLSVEEVADFLGVPVNTLYQWRHEGTGPTAFRVGRFLRYDPAEVRDWLTTNAEVTHGAR
ncbi:helix-turn-helix domain-containing protein [Janibacter melonis]|uniref:helix-turn-helix transcriptional regulator n=1 Tax=Janibacter melonis TaxID=262209 RepID=UPI00177EF069|nr:DNA-binding protein [Janibacter melonis]